MKIHDENDEIFSTPTKSYKNPQELPAEVLGKQNGFSRQNASISCSKVDVQIETRINLTIDGQLFIFPVYGKLIHRPDADEGVLHYIVNHVGFGMPNQNRLPDVELHSMIEAALNKHFSSFFWQPVVVEIELPKKTLPVGSVNNPSVSNPTDLF